MDRLLGEMQSQMDRLVWENKELEERLKTALKEHKAMEEILDEMEEEHEDAFARIDLLESQVINSPSITPYAIQTVYAFRRAASV